MQFLRPPQNQIEKMPLNDLEMSNVNHKHLCKYEASALKG